MASQRSADKRDAIVSAAYRCIARNGYERTSTAQMCAAAGVSSGTFFHYFPTKAAVLVAVLHRDLHRVRKVMAELTQQAAADAWIALERWCTTVIDDASSSDLPGFAAALGTVPDDPDISAAIDAETQLVHAALVEIVTAGQRQKSVRSDRLPEDLATWLRVLSDGVLQHVLTSGQRPSDRLQHELTDAVRRLMSP